MVASNDAILEAGNGHPVRGGRSWRGLVAYWPLWLIVMIGIGLRIFEIGRIPGMHGDEAWYGLQARNLLAELPFELRTPTGNVPGLIQMGSLTALHSLFPPSLLLLRLPALLSSIAALWLTWLIGRRFFGERTAMAALLLMAVMPMNLAYARFGWDPSHAGLLVLLAIYTGLAKRRPLSALVFTFALTNHPSAVFVAPFLTLACLGIDLQEGRTGRDAAANTAAYVGYLLLAILVAMLLSPATSHYLNAGRSVERLADPTGWIAYSTMFVHFLSGQTVYVYLTGQGYGAARPLSDMLVGAGLVGTLVGGIFILKSRASWMIVGLVAGWLASLMLLYLVAGTWVLRPQYERFSFPMIPLTCLTIAGVMGQCLSHGWRGRLFQPILLVAGTMFLAGFWVHYLRALDRGEARPGPWAWTGPSVAYESAFKQIERSAAPGQGARIIADNGWSYRPLAYFAAGSRFAVSRADRPTQQSAAPEGGTYWVAYKGGKFDLALARRSDVQRRQLIRTSNSENALQIWWKAPAPIADN